MRAEIFEDIDKNLLAKFKTYHLENPHVFREFKINAEKMKKTGRKKYSAWTIVNKIRWDHDLKTLGEPFKINNDYIALFARLLIYQDPTYRDFFELRTMKKYDRRDSGEERYRKRDLQEQQTMI